jgi:hypothetical protein
VLFGRGRSEHAATQATHLQSPEKIKELACRGETLGTSQARQM